MRKLRVEKSVMLPRSLNSEELLYSQLVIPSIVSAVQDVEVECDGEKHTVHLNDIGVLFNQTRLSALGSDSVNAFVKQLRDSAYLQSQSNLDLSKVSDDDLLSFCKSRFIQSPCELKRWISSLDGYARQMLSNVSENQSVESSKSE